MEVSHPFQSATVLGEQNIQLPGQGAPPGTTAGAPSTLPSSNLLHPMGWVSPLPHFRAQEMRLREGRPGAQGHTAWEQQQQQEQLHGDWRLAVRLPGSLRGGGRGCRQPWVSREPAQLISTKVKK